MVSIYHYCAVWEQDGRIVTSGGVMKSPVPITYDNYGAFVQRVAEHLQVAEIGITSLSYLGQEHSDLN